MLFLFFFGKQGDEEPEQIQCSFCTQLNDAEYDFCTKCGRRLPKSPAPFTGLFRTPDLFKWCRESPVGKFCPNPDCRKSANEVFNPKANVCGFCGKSPLQDLYYCGSNWRVGLRVVTCGVLGFILGCLLAPSLLPIIPEGRQPPTPFTIDWGKLLTSSSFDWSEMLTYTGAIGWIGAIIGAIAGKINALLRKLWDVCKRFLFGFLSGTVASFVAPISDDEKRLLFAGALVVFMWGPVIRLLTPEAEKSIKELGCLPHS